MLRRSGLATPLRWWHPHLFRHTCVFDRTVATRGPGGACGSIDIHLVGCVVGPRAAFDLSKSSEEEKADFQKLRAKWEQLESTVDAELKQPVPDINWADWEKKIRDSKAVIPLWKQVIAKNSYDAEASSAPAIAKEHARVNKELFAYMESAATQDKVRLATLKAQRESLLWEKYNVDSLTFDVMMARYPVLAEEIYAEVDAQEWMVDTGIVEAPKGWGVLVLDSAGKATPKPAEDPHHHH